MSGEAQEAEGDKMLEEAEEAFSTFEQLLSEMEGFADTIDDVEQEILDKTYEAIAKQLEAFDVTINIKMDLRDAQKKWNEFKRRVLDKDADTAVGRALQARDDYFSNLAITDTNGNILADGILSDRTNRQQQMMGWYNEFLNNQLSAENPFAKDGVFDEAVFWEKYQENLDDIMDTLIDMEDQVDAVHEAVLEGIDDLKDSYDKLYDIYQLIGDQIEHDMKMAELLHGEQSYDLFATQYERKIENNTRIIASLQDQAAYWEEKMHSALDDEEREKYEENWKDTISNLNSEIENWAENLASQYENTISQIMADFERQLTGNGLGFDFMQEELDLVASNADNYLDEINKAYSLQDLRSKWNKSIDDSSSLATQEKLNALMQQQLNYLEEKGKLTQYDIDRAEKEYEIALKQIALQEAQQNKSKMRLKRDANGNYSYQYVSDEDAIKDAYNDLAAAQNELYNFDKDRYTSVLDEAAAAYQEYAQKIHDINIQYANNEVERQARLNLAQEQLQNKLVYLTEATTTAKTNLQNSAYQEIINLYGKESEMFSQMVDDQGQVMLNQMIPQFNTTIASMIARFATDEDSFKAIFMDTTQKLQKATQKYNADLKQVEDISNRISDSVTKNAKEMESKTNALINTNLKNLDVLKQTENQLKAINQQYQDIIDNAKNAAIAAKDFKAQQQAAALNATANPNNTTLPSGNNLKNPNGGKTNPGGTNGASHPQSQDVYTGVAANIWYYGGWGVDPERRSLLTQKFGAEGAAAIQNTVDAMVNGEYMNYDPDWIANFFPAQFKKGGLADFTGPAWLDGTSNKPELVLNATDTENILNAVSTMRSISDTLSRNALGSMNMLLARIATISDSLNISSREADVLEQNVTINAQFEGQTTADEIQDALDGLVNRASQYANRNYR